MDILFSTGSLIIISIDDYLKALDGSFSISCDMDSSYTTSTLTLKSAEFPKDSLIVF